MKKILSVFLAAVLLIGVCFVPAHAVTDAPDLTAEGAVVMDFTTGEVLWQKDPDKQLYPASLTKVLTALVVLENLSLGKTLKADDEVASTGGSRLKMKVGETISAKDALYVMLIGSCNDLAVLLAKAVSGSVSEFCKLMNEKAKELGCTGTNCTNPNGLHDADHYTTAHDMAIIARAAMENAIFRDIVRSDSFSYTRGSGAEKPGTVETITTTNWMLNDTTHAMYVGSTRRTPKYDGCIGIKTGHTPEARGCLVAAATRDGSTMLSVVLHSDGDSNGSYERFVDTIKLLDWAFANYRTVSVLKMGMEMGTLKVKKGKTNKVNAVLASDVYATLSSEQDDSVITYDVELDKTIKAPFNQGTVCGKVTVKHDGEFAGEYEIVTASAVKEGGFFSNFGISDELVKKIAKILLYIIIAAFLIFAGYIGYLKIKSERIKKRKAARAAARREAEERERERDRGLF